MIRPQRGVLALVALVLASAARAEVPVVLPPGEVEAEWRHALSLVGLEVARELPGAGARVAVDAGGAGWVLVVIDADGAERRAEVPAPRTAAEREGVAFLASSLLEVAVLPAIPAAPAPPRPAAPEPAADVAVGVGLVLGTPTGVSAQARRGWLAADAAIGSALPGPAGHVTALVVRLAPIGEGGVELGGHAGLGACLRQRLPGLATRPGLRAPAGFDLEARRLRLGLFAEGAVVVLSGPWVSTHVELAVGARWLVVPPRGRP